ncbi:alpha-(1-_3)-arabinofuranosyltransferase family protein [Streptomyces sp. NPDC059578]|uniref:alpha-(1->3)-arabinofuranosyltransferase domain-containing protein n=1 Tax=unclassified Streptomyces TaxID=2593676 RepID=UPI00365BFEB8
MTTTAPAAQAPPPVADRGPGATDGPFEAPRSRRWLAGFWAAVFVLFLAAAPGRMTFETKLGVAVDPWQFIADLGQLWNDRGGFGTLADQYIGYAFPMLPYYGLADLVQLPVWIAERLWLSIVVTAAFWGALRLAERLRVGNRATRLLGAAVYALWPTYTIVVGSTSAAALPGALLPWVLLPLLDERYAARVAALRSALLVVCMGGVNAASTLASLLPVALYLLTRPRGPRQRALLLWWVPGVLLATLWWVLPLLLLGVYGENFLPYVETAAVTTDTMAATETLRGAGNWVAYLNFGEPWLPGGWSVAASVPVVLASAVAAALGLAGLARRDLPERRWLTLTVLTVALLTLAGYGGKAGAPFAGGVQDLLDGALAPFRNVYKFQTGLALALVIGLIHLVAVAVREDGARPVRGRRWAPALAAVVIVPGLALPYANGSVLQPGSFQKLPTYWETTAKWLKENSPDSRALVVPATAHGVYTWGSPIDQPLDVLAESRWAQRDYVPFGTAGNRRAMDAVEQALLTGGEVPGLGDFLSRAGLHYVVVRNDLDPDQLGYVPTPMVKRTLEQSGFERVTGFGPVMTGGRIADDTPLDVEGLFPRQRAVEVYQPAIHVRRPGQATIYPAADTAVVSGGPETLLPLSGEPSLRNRPTVLTGDRHPGVEEPAFQVLGDGMRRADTRFGLVNTNTSYTYTERERNHAGSVQDPGDAPHQILPKQGTEHQTVAELRGAREVTASSSGNWLFHLPQYDPVHAFDGNPDTAWTVGTPGDASGEWIRIAFDAPKEMPSSLTVTPLPQNGTRAAPIRVRVETERGSETSALDPNGRPQDVASPHGETDWLRITVLESEAGRPGLTGAGFAEIEVPDVRVTRMLRLPTDAQDTPAAAEKVVLHRLTDPAGLSPAGAESGLHRTFTTSGSGEHGVTMRAVPVPGAALDRLRYRAGTGSNPDRVVATADSTAKLGAQVSPRNLTDGDVTTAWVAGDEPVVRLRWGQKQSVDRLVLTAAGGLSARPTQVQISSPDGATVANVDDNGWVRFDPITTDRMDITITRTADVTLHNPVANADLQLPAGLAEVTLPTLGGTPYRTARQPGDTTFTLKCGEGPAVAIDGIMHATRVTGTVRDLEERRPVKVTLCQRGKADPKLTLGAGSHTVQAGDEGPLALTSVTLTRGEVRPTTTSRDLTIDDWLGDRRKVTVGSGAVSYLTTYENINDGWKATLNGKELSPVRLDGWQQGFEVPAGEGGEVTLTYEPARTYEIGLVLSGAALLALIGLVLWRRREADPHGPSGAPGEPGLLLGTVALTLVAAVVAGWLALLVPLLAVVALRRHALLVPIAFLSMTAAGLVAATGAGAPPVAGEGAYGYLAQVLSLIALFAALVTTGGRGRPSIGLRRRHRAVPGTPAEAGGPSTAPPAPPTGAETTGPPAAPPSPPASTGGDGT